MVTRMGKTHYIIPIFVPDLGCPHQCVFCNQKKITGLHDIPNAQKVEEIIAQYLDTIPMDSGITKEVAFYGGSFTAVDPTLQKKLLSPAYQALTNGQVNGIRVSTRPDAVSEEVMSLLSAYGVNTIELGVQSMDDTVLAMSGRGHTSRDVLRATVFTKSWGMNLGFQMMVGLPGDTEEKDINTAYELIALKPDLIRIYPCLVLRDTPLADLYKSGNYLPLTVVEAVGRCKKLLLVFEKMGINIIRIGLQPSEQINLTGDVIAGPYHPAFRELVESSLALDQVEYLLAVRAGMKAANKLVLDVPEEDISITRGHKADNVGYFRKKYGVTEFITNIDKMLPRGSVKLVSADDREFGITVTRLELPAEVLGAKHN